MEQILLQLGAELPGRAYSALQILCGMPAAGHRDHLELWLTMIVLGAAGVIVASCLLKKGKKRKK